MRRFTVNVFELPDKVKLRKTCLISNIAKVNIICIVGINKKFCLN